MLSNLTFSDSLAALATGSVDAAYLIEPLMQSAQQRDIGKILMTGDQIYLNQQVAVLLYCAEFCRRRGCSDASSLAGIFAAPPAQYRPRARSAADGRST